MTDTASDELRIAISMGPDYDASPRLTAAIEELHAALVEADGDDVVGFAETVHLYKAGFSLGYVSGGSDGSTGGSNFDISINKWDSVKTSSIFKF